MLSPATGCGFTSSVLFRLPLLSLMPVCRANPLLVVEAMSAPYYILFIFPQKRHVQVNAQC